MFIVFLNMKLDKILKLVDAPCGTGRTFHMSELISTTGMLRRNAVLDTTNVITCMCGDVISVYEAHTHYTTACSHMNNKTNVITCMCGDIISVYEARTHYTTCSRMSS